MAGDRRDSVVGVQEGCVFRCACLAARRTTRNPERSESVVVRQCEHLGERDLVRGSERLVNVAERLAERHQRRVARGV